MFGLGHVDMMPLFAGLIYALGIFSMWHKWKTRRYFGAITELAIFVLLMKLHGGTLAGGVGATIAALIVGSFISPKKTKQLSCIDKELNTTGNARDARY